MYVGQHLILETWGMLHLWYAVEYMWSSGRKSAMGTIECHTLMHLCPAQTPFHITHTTSTSCSHNNARLHARRRRT